MTTKRPAHEDTDALTKKATPRGKNDDADEKAGARTADPVDAEKKKNSLTQKATHRGADDDDDDKAGPCIRDVTHGVPAHPNRHCQGAVPYL